MGHSVGKAAENATNKSNRKTVAARTPEQVLVDIRRNLETGLAVTPDDQRWLLSERDRIHAEWAADEAEVERLREQNQELKNEILNLRDARTLSYPTLCLVSPDFPESAEGHS